MKRILYGSDMCETIFIHPVMKHIRTFFYRKSEICTSLLQYSSERTLQKKKLFCLKYWNFCAEYLQTQKTYLSAPFYMTNYDRDYSVTQLWPVSRVFFFLSCLIHLFTTIKGVCHADELIYLFPSAKIFGNFTATLEEEQMADCLIDMWTNFARTG